MFTAPSTGGGGLVASLGPWRGLGRGQLELGQDDGIELPVGAIRQALPILILAEHREAEEAANGQVLAVGAQLHQGAPLVAVDRVEDRAVFVVAGLALHVRDDGVAEVTMSITIARRFEA